MKKFRACGALDPTPNGQHESHASQTADFLLPKGHWGVIGKSVFLAEKSLDGHWERFPSSLDTLRDIITKTHGLLIDTNLGLALT